ncbi:solute carrier family 25 member 36 [Plakobranchus ocellatus]|uniref:Solute carrier family 25 member 36 n=1 Tax=Plakobranchus ocellatus TaxID=259542 RepID=A0AAV4ATW3_9GAST|nr:solute carrier family 25 member 36 [Plakobranchus ocellatus]
MESSKNVIHLIAGGTAGTTGAVLTCPLEVVKTRLQSSVSSFVQVNVHAALRLLPSQQVVTLSTHSGPLSVEAESVLTHAKPGQPTHGLIRCLRHIIKTEGIRGLFKGLGPTLVGVAPSRAIYFGAYANSKQMLNGVITPETHFVHLCSAIAAGVSAATCTNPIWFVKTRLQLDQKIEGKLTCRECVRRIYRENGLRGFYKGISASYFGVSETVIHLVIYETIKSYLQQYKHSATQASHDRLSAGASSFSPSSSPQLSSSSSSATNSAVSPHVHAKTTDKSGGESDSSSFTLASAKDAFLASDYLKFMLAGACSKTFATCLCYPHEVARTRLREEGSRYNSFFQTLYLVFKEEGRAGLYRGLSTQLIRQIPNTAIVMATYEAVVHLLMPDE